MQPSGAGAMALGGALSSAALDKARAAKDPFHRAPKPASHSWFGCCTACSDTPVDPNEEVVSEGGEDEALDSRTQKFLFRMCVHSALLMSDAAAYVEVELMEGTPRAVKLQGPVASASSCYTWEYCINQEIEVDKGKKAEAILKVFEKHALTNTSTGIAVIPLPAEPTPWPVVQTLTVVGGDPASVRVAWELCPPRPDDGAPIRDYDLLLMADIGADSEFYEGFHVEASASRLHFTTPQWQPQRYEVRFNIFNRRTGKHVSMARVSPKEVGYTPEDLHGDTDSEDSFPWEPVQGKTPSTAHPGALPDAAP